MFANLQAAEPEYSGYTASTFDPRINNFAGEPMSGGENVEYLDYAVVSSSTHRKLTTITALMCLALTSSELQEALQP